MQAFVSIPLAGINWYFALDPFTVVTLYLYMQVLLCMAQRSQGQCSPLWGHDPKEVAKPNCGVVSATF